MKWHASVPFKIETGETKKSASVRTYTQVFGDVLAEMAEDNVKIAAITAAMCEGTGLVKFSKRFPERFFDVGIAEEHGVAFAAGLAKAGMRPFVAIYSTFLQRAHDQIIHDVALQSLPVIFCLDRAGLVGEDGPTHHGVFDIAYLRKIPGLTVMAPKDGRELELMLELALKHKEGPVAIRYPRGAVAEETVTALKDIKPTPLRKGKYEMIREGKDVLILAVGSMVYPAYEAAELLDKEGVSACVVNIRFIKPLDEAALKDLMSRFSLTVTVEEGCLMGGFGDAVLEIAAGKNFVKTLGIPDRFIEHGKREALLDSLHLSPRGIKDEVLKTLHSETSWRER